MCTAQVKQMYAARPVPVYVRGLGGRTVWSEVFDHNPKIVRHPNGGAVQTLLNGPGARPYIQGKLAERWLWKRWPIEPGELHLTAAERAFAEPYRGMVMVEPHVKARNTHQNKAWPWQRWQELVALLNLPFVQCGPEGTAWLPNVTRVITPTFRHACAVLSVARAFVGTEGGLHHGAAALGVPAVVLWSEFIDPEFTGYPSHRNIRHAGDACGARLPCAGCAASMEAIRVGEVGEHVAEVVKWR